MDLWLGITFWAIFILSTFMTASALVALKGRTRREEEMQNIFEQVMGAVRAGDLPRSILLLEGEPGTLPTLLSSILTEATKFTPKLRVAYKVTMETQKRRSKVRQNPLRLVAYTAPVVGLLSILSPIFGLMSSSVPSAWLHAFIILLIGVAVGVLSYFLLKLAEKQDQDALIEAGEYGRKMLNYLLGPESPLKLLRGQAFPPLQ